MSSMKYLLGVFIVLVGCSQLPEDAVTTPHGLEEVKSNDQDYVSTNAREYTISGTAEVSLATVSPTDMMTMMADEDPFAAAVARS